MAAADAKFPISIPFTSGRGDATQEQTDTKSFQWMETKSDAFRNLNASPYKMVDHAHMLALTTPEMVALLGGMRVLDANHRVKSGDQFVTSPLGVFTATPGVLSTDYFVNLLDMSTAWEK